MHEDDEQRFPRITLWQFLTGLFWWRRDMDKFFDGRWVSDIASLNTPEKKQSAADANKKPSSGAAEQSQGH